MHPARLRIHPARPGEGSCAPRAGPSGRPAPCLPGGPGGRAPGLPRSFHFENTLRKFAKLVSRWLLCASREGAAHQPAVAAAAGGSRWLPRGLRRVAWEAGRARGRAGAALPEPAGPHRAAQTPAAGCCLGGALGRRPLGPRSPRPRPSWAPPPAPPRIVQPGGEPARRCAPGGSLWRRRGAAGGGRAHSPAASPPDLPGGRGLGSRAGKGRAGGPPGGSYRWGGGSAGPGRGAARSTPTPTAATTRAELIRGERRAGRRAGWAREGRGRVPRCPRGGRMARPGSGTAAAAAGRLHIHSTMREAKVLHSDKTWKCHWQLTGSGSHRV